jgi:hypothetical protein
MSRLRGETRSKELAWQGAAPARKNARHTGSTLPLPSVSNPDIGPLA